MKKTLTGPRGIRIELDRSQVFPDDPGQGTPALVHYKGGVATYWCACDEGEVDNNSRYIKLPQDVLDWLHEQDDEITNFLYK